MSNRSIDPQNARFEPHGGRERGEAVCRFSLLGRLDYAPARELQKSLAEKVLSNGEDILLLLEHPPTYTLGLRGSEDNLLASREALAREGAAVINVDRGGDVTFHGPGQLVGYPILNLAKLGGGIHKYLRTLEQALVLTLESFGVKAGTVDGYTGVWIGDEKIAAIGVKVTGKRITQHGFALNVNTDLDRFCRIVPCGIKDKGVTSLARLTGQKTSLRKVALAFARSFGTVFGKEMIEIAPDSVLDGPVPQNENAVHRFEKARSGGREAGI